MLSREVSKGHVRCARGIDRNVGKIDDIWQESCAKRATERFRRPNQILV